ncbi:hypothetical protein [Edaphobacter albus]|uniref:hypothetical protein n=1 Tax=Edaphobacter sp. 4G125 TaxID=2763071 RepID=UPI00164847A1|nr:hypothetical protein [Edaphobacter sp. 4G125]QNI36437.1 hypothetical protein H7846_15955 [Edaphobacter sp. 4G125]
MLATRIGATVTSRPYLALGLTFLLLGIGFGFPVRLAPAPPKHIWEDSISNEAINLYALTAFAGWSHFIYAWRGQIVASRKFSSIHRGTYWLTVVVLIAAFVGLRTWLGIAVFSLLAWVYNIAHFVKAEVFFSGTIRTKAAFYSPVVAFGWFTLCLFQVGPLHSIHLVFAGSLAIAALILSMGGWRLLASNEVRLPLLTLFLLGETMVWASYSPYMSDSFRVGVYIFHIAAASFYHYLTAYFYAESANAKNADFMLSPASIILTNLFIILIGLSVAWLPDVRWLRPVFGLEWFTLWVALHLAASDLLPWWKRRLTI